VSVHIKPALSQLLVDFATSEPQLSPMMLTQRHVKHTEHPAYVVGMQSPQLLGTALSDWILLYHLVVDVQSWCCWTAYCQRLKTPNLMTGSASLYTAALHYS